MMKYGAEASVQFQLREYISRYAVQNAIDQVQYSFGHCYLAGALRKAAEMFSTKNGGRQDSRKVLVVVGRAVVDSKQHEVMEAVRRLKNNDVELATVVVDGEEEGIRTMGKMASNHEGSWSVGNFNQLNDYYAHVLKFLFEGECIRLKNF